MVERILGKAEVDSSILSGGTTLLEERGPMTRPNDCETGAAKADAAREKRLAEALRANLRRRKVAAKTRKDEEP